MLLSVEKVNWYIFSPFYDSYLHLAHTIYFFVTVLFFLITCRTGITGLTHSAVLTSWIWFAFSPFPQVTK